MKDKEYTDVYGATTATTLRLTEKWKASGRIVVGDSWFQPCQLTAAFGNAVVKTVVNFSDDGNFNAVAKNGQP